MLTPTACGAMFPRIYNFALLTVFFGLTSFYSGSANAQERISAAVLNLEGENVDDELVTTLTSVVRNEAQQVDKYEVVNKFAINLKDVLLLVGCDSPTRSCLRRAAEQVEARVLIFGEVSATNGNFQTSVNIFDADTGKMINQFTRTLEQTDDPVVAFRKEIETFFADERTVPMTRVQIGSNVEGAKVRLEGTYVGTVPLERKGLPPGTYSIEVFHPDYTSWETRLELTEGADVRLWAPLKPSSSAGGTPVAQETTNGPGGEVESNETTVGETGEPIDNRLSAGAQAPDSPRGGTNWGAWSTLAVGGLALGGSAVFAVLMSNVESDIEQGRETGLTRAEYDQLVDDGESYELTHRVLLGVGIVGVIGGVTWLIVDNAMSDEVALDVGVAPNGVEARLRW